MCDNKNYITDIVGYIGGIILSICLIPQIIKIYQTKHVENLSYTWQLMYITGISLHLYYAIYYNLLPIFIPTIVEICLVLFMLFLKIIYKNKNKNKIAPINDPI